MSPRSESDLDSTNDIAFAWEGLEDDTQFVGVHAFLQTVVARLAPRHIQALARLRYKVTLTPL